MPGGRPTLYSEELIERICFLTATHPVGLKKLCAMYDDIPEHTTIKRWRWENEQFNSRYAKAKMFQAEMMVEELEDLADEVATYYDEKGNVRIDSGSVAQQRLRCDNRKWTAAKLAPKIYGDRQQITTTVKHEENLKDLE